MTRFLLITFAVVGLAAISCKQTEPAKHLPFEAITVDHARMRTDIVGIGQWAENSAYVLADAKNTAKEGAYVTLAGEMLDAAGTPLSKLRPQSIYIPPGEQRTFALVDADRKPRPDAKGAKVLVRGALVPPKPPDAKIEELHTFDDHGQLVLQAWVVNNADRPGTVMVLASFHDADGLPLERPFKLQPLQSGARESVRFVGPEGSKTGMIYVGEIVH